MDMSKIQRALGFIEGVCTGLKEKEAELIEGAIVEIDCELEDVPGDCHVALQGNAPRNDISKQEIPRSHRGVFTAGEMDELVERLEKHYLNYTYCNPFDRAAAFRDMKTAAETITRLRLLIEDLEYAGCAEKP